MKKIIGLLVLCFAFSFSGQSQVVNVAGNNDYQMAFIPGKVVDNSEEFKKIAHKMYSTTKYLPAQVDGVKGEVYLRYNIYKDEMEFLRNEELLNLRKVEDKKITFKLSKKEYQILELNGNLKYFRTHNKGKNVLVSRKIVEYQKAKPAASSYQNAKPANFKRKSDEIFINFEGKGLVKVSKKKKKFYTIFGKNASKIKDFVKKNKLNIKEISDLKKIVEHYNSI